MSNCGLRINFFIHLLEAKSCHLVDLRTLFPVSNRSEFLTFFVVSLPGCLSALVYQHAITPLALPCKLLIPTAGLSQHLVVVV